MLYRLERRGWVAGRWVEKPNERRKRFYRLTAAGKKALAAQRKSWLEAGGSHWTRRGGG